MRVMDSIVVSSVIVRAVSTGVGKRFPHGGVS